MSMYWDVCTKIDEWVEKKIHNLWCSETLFIPALKGIPKELIARASPIKATSPGAIHKQQTTTTVLQNTDMSISF